MNAFSSAPQPHVNLHRSMKMSTGSKPMGSEQALKASNILQNDGLNCVICEKILSIFRRSSGHDWLGTVSSILTGSCPHVEGFRNLESWDGKQIANHEEEEVLAVKFSASQPHMKFQAAHLELHTEDAYLLHRAEVHDHPGKALTVDSQWIDEGTVNSWISTCEKVHGDRCRYKAPPVEEKGAELKPLYLIDTVEHCIVASSDDAQEYVALSYVWGQTQSLRNNTKICRKLLRKGSLLDGEFSQLLPQTIKDAISIVRILGKRYLWVDALCILQDDEQFLKRELDRMHLIYACASFTIIAAVGKDANHGLRGFKNLTAPRKRRQVAIQLEGSEKLILDNSTRPSGRTWDMTQYTSYYDRGWTFQEFVFSRRRMIFQNEGIMWECQCSSWHEDLIPHSNFQEGKENNRLDMFFYRTVPELFTLRTPMVQYNQKLFTFPEDAVSAFQGFQSILHRTFPGGLLYGHPEFFFDITLSWYPRHNFKRRVPRTSTKHLPSWSWLGWDGTIWFPSDVENCGDLGLGSTELEGYRSPVASWYTANSPCSIQKRRINSAWHDYRLLAQNEAAEIPSGWTKHDFKLDTEYYGERDISNMHILLEFRGIPRYCFSHPDLVFVGPYKRYLWYPIPMLEPDSPNPPIEAQTAFIFAQTSRAYLSVRTICFKPQRIPRKHEVWHPPSVHLSDRSGNFVGYLRLHNNDDLDEFGEEIEANGRKLVELVATCKGYTGKIFDHELAERIKEESGAMEWAPQLKNCYFVLWIEWKDGVAYRRAGGAVTEEAWDSEKESELVDLVLG
ncbi:hypothetical protein HYFRA_00007720 [Hymenoscyphus fraxineus]|uniref:Heterokaryon incompatibility domain-containing protein n=1 Tax=Hymenoscyphus fraxineus TaxID=746836 RepID=A0A9N9PN05_9HELO|nr:hypothetical protein HYFRA_00007720 [Hymenoscyphus fraxineus]